MQALVYVSRFYMQVSGQSMYFLANQYSNPKNLLILYLTQE